MGYVIDVLPISLCPLWTIDQVVSGNQSLTAILNETFQNEWLPNNLYPSPPDYETNATAFNILLQKYISFFATNVFQCKFFSLV
jgi:hypothetical protein